MSAILTQIVSGIGGIAAGVLIWVAVDRDLRDALRDLWHEGLT